MQKIYAFRDIFVCAIGAYFWYRTFKKHSNRACSYARKINVKCGNMIEILSIFVEWVALSRFQWRSILSSIMNCIELCKRLYVAAFLTCFSVFFYRCFPISNECIFQNTKKNCEYYYFNVASIHDSPLQFSLPYPILRFFRCHCLVRSFILSVMQIRFA